MLHAMQCVNFYVKLTVKNKKVQPGFETRLMMIQMPLYCIYTYLSPTL